jgi:hypothetical protein
MLAIEKIAGALPQPAPTHPESVICAVTGRRTNSAVPCDKVFTDAFSNRAFFAAPTAPWRDKRVAEILKRPELRLRSWTYADGEVNAVERKNVVDFLVGRRGETWAVYAAVDCRTHGALLTPLNRGWADGVIQIGRRRAMLKETMDYHNRVASVYGFVGRKTLTTLTPAPKELTAYGYGRWLTFKTWAQRVYETPEYELAVWLLPLKERAENAGDKRNIQTGPA